MRCPTLNELQPTRISTGLAGYGPGSRVSDLGIQSPMGNELGRAKRRVEGFERGQKRIHTSSVVTFWHYLQQSIE